VAGKNESAVVREVSDNVFQLFYEKYVIFFVCFPSFLCNESSKVIICLMLNPYCRFRSLIFGIDRSPVSWFTIFLFYVLVLSVFRTVACFVIFLSVDNLLFF
jgi:hypothetical protein